MSDLLELLTPYFETTESPSSTPKPPTHNDLQTTSYLARLSTLALNDLNTTEPASLLHAAQTHIRNLQALSKRSHKAVITSSSQLANLTTLLPSLGTQARDLKDAVPALEIAASEFAQKYDRSTENAVLDKRKRAMLLSRNVDRVSDVLELPSLLSSAVAAAQVPSTSSGASASTSYASALDLHAHIRRLSALYPQSDLVGDISKQAEMEIQNLTTILITSLMAPSLKLAAAMRTIGWLRRVAPDLAEDDFASSKQLAGSIKSLRVSGVTSTDGALGTLFLICRLRTLRTTLEALEPLRDLADQESSQRKHVTNGMNGKQTKKPSDSLGNQSERYLKRYIEIFREQSFAIVSMYRSVFPTDLPSPEAAALDEMSISTDPLLPLPLPLSSFALYLVDMLMATLREYMPNVADKSSRESLLTQVLYCAGSLGRLGADFGMMIAMLEEELAEDGDSSIIRDDELEWVQVMKKHRVQASRLEVLARGVGSGRKASTDLQSPTALPAT
jgi:conserved oligomeric Golgi complex subunit 8